jgi:hypothetical protein
MNPKPIKCPCEDCLCVPICRHKNYTSLFYDCSLIDDYTREKPFKAKMSSPRVKILEDILKPSKWSIRGNMVF